MAFLTAGLASSKMPMLTVHLEALCADAAISGALLKRTWNPEALAAEFTGPRVACTPATENCAAEETAAMQMSTTEMMKRRLIFKPRRWNRLT